MRTIYLYSPVAIFAALTLTLFLSSCGTMGDSGGGHSSDSTQQNTPPPSSSSVYVPPPPPSSSSSLSYTLTANASPSGAGTVSPAQARYSPGAQATVTATPTTSGYSFSRWTGASTSTSNPITVTMNSDKTLTAIFEQVANAVIITLTYWHTTETDLFGEIDPRIYFKVIAKNGNATVSSNNTSDLLNADDVGQTWSGSKKSSAIPFITSATELQIHAVALEMDGVSGDDDISPGFYQSFDLPIPSGKSGSVTLDYGTGKSKVSFNYEFVWQ